MFEDHRRALVLFSDLSLGLCGAKTLEVMGSIPVRCWAFSLFLSLSSASVKRSLKEVQYWFSFMLSYAAWGETSIISTYLAKNIRKLRQHSFCICRFWPREERPSWSSSTPWQPPTWSCRPELPLSSPTAWLVACSQSLAIPWHGVN